MPGRQVRKRLHYVRAVYNSDAHPPETFQTLLDTALYRKRVSQTEIAMGSHGTMAVRDRQKATGHTMLAIGSGVPGEAMSTMGLAVATAQDTDASTNPPPARAFKLADAFCLVHDDDLILCLDGIRIPTVGTYLSRLLDRSLNRPDASAFELRPVSNLEQEQVLEREGVKEIRFAGTMFGATAELENEEPPNTLRRFLGSMRALLEREAKSDAEREALARHWSDLNVSTVVTAKGGSKAEPVVLSSMLEAGKELLESDDDAGFNISLLTRDGSKVTPNDLILGHYVNLTRKEGRNDLSHIDVWNRLQEYVAELRQNRQWQN